MSIDSAQINIRPARKDDAGAITQLVNQLAASLGESSSVNEEYVRRYLDTPGAGILMADAEGQVVGMLSFTLRPSLYHAATSCMIEELMVGEGFRRGGIGGRLLDAIFLLARERGCVEVSVSALTSNRGALDLYRRHGFSDEAVLLEQHLRGEG